MLFKDLTDSPSGLGYIYRGLELHTAPGRKVLLNSMMFTRASDIRSELEKVEAFHRVLGSKVEIEHLKGILCTVRDVYGTIQRISDASSVDDIELFEIKDLSFTAVQLSQALSSLGINAFQIPDMTGIISILDPEGLKLRSFYIYDAYSKELAKLRVEIRKGEDVNGAERQLELLAKADEAENRIRFALSARLKPLAPRMKKTLDMIGSIDLALAKAELMQKYSLVIPEFSEDGHSTYKGMFHPQVADSIAQKGLSFTAIDIDFGRGVSLIIGANMGGKTVVLKMLALCQQMCQFGFPVPAASARIALKNNLFFSIGDDQDIERGLSSFAAEMLSINGILEHLENEKEQIDRETGRGLEILASGNGTLALVDEPARTTNPIEGKALVEALVKMLGEYNVDAVITTHYNIDCQAEARWRVSGLRDGKMDYRLVTTSTNDIPHEAVMVARSLNINERWIGLAQEILNGKQ